MTPEEVGARLAASLGEPCEVSTSGGGQWARPVVDVPATRWREAMRAVRDQLDCRFFDWLSAVDEGEDRFTVVAHLWSVSGRHGVLLRTRASREAPRLDSVVELFKGAAWHERETYEMFGIVFDGHPGLAPLLLPPEFEGQPLRKDFVLASRVAKPWPGAKEPGEGHATPARGKRAPMRPPGVPDPQEWGPQARHEPADPEQPSADPEQPPGGPAETDGS